MRKAILFLLATMMMAGCAEQQVFDDVASYAPEQVTKTENFNDLIVDDLSVKDVGYQAYDLAYRADGARLTEDLTNP